MNMYIDRENNLAVIDNRELTHEELSAGMVKLEELALIVQDSGGLGRAQDGILEFLNYLYAQYETCAIEISRIG